MYQILSGASLSHTFTASGATTPTTDPLTDPDDITRMGDKVFVGFQNGVGPQGQASPDGNVSSTVVEMSLSGDLIAQWDIVGKCDGLTANPHGGYVIATVNEDANSSLYTIEPRASSASQLQHFAYSQALAHNGGTDAISFFHGHILISASAPGTTGTVTAATSPAVYEVVLDWSTKVAAVSPLFFDGSSAIVANVDNPRAGLSTTLSPHRSRLERGRATIERSFWRGLHARQSGRPAPDLCPPRRPARPEPVSAPVVTVD